MNKSFALLLLAVGGVVGCEAPVAEHQHGDGPPVSSAAPPVDAQRVSDPAPKVQQQFASVDEALGVLIKATDEDDRDRQLASYNWLAGQGEGAVPAVVAAMNDEAISIESRRLACRVLGQLGPAAEPALLEASASDELPLQLKAIESLAAVEPPSRQIVDRLISLMENENEQVRRTAIRSLGNIGTPARAAADKLQALRNSVEANETIRGEADRALKRVRPIRTFND